jgi:hypothetical protein
MPTLRDELRKHHGRNFHITGAKVANPTTWPDGQNRPHTQTRLVRYDYTMRPIIGEAGHRMVRIAFREVRWYRSGLLLSEEDYARLESRLVKEALEDAYEHGDRQTRRAVENVRLLSSVGAEGGPVWKSALQDFVDAARFEETDALPERVSLSETTWAFCITSTPTPLCLRSEMPTARTTEKTRTGLLSLFLLRRRASGTRRAAKSGSFPSTMRYARASRAAATSR